MATMVDKVQLQHNDNEMKDNTRRSIIEQLFWLSGYRVAEGVKYYYCTPLITSPKFVSD